MASSFIPAFHFDNPESKLTSEWALKAIQSVYYNNDNRSLLDGKNISIIEQWATGNIDMTPFKKMFKSLKKKIDNKIASHPDGTVNDDLFRREDPTGLSWEPLPLIPQKLNSAIATISKIPIEVQCVAQDGLAMQKRKQDIEFLKNKAAIEADLQDIANQMNIGKVDIGATKNGSKKFSNTPMGMDLSDPDEENIFAQLIYSLNVESSFEKALQIFYNLKKANQIRLLEIIDQFKYGVSLHDSFASSMTGLPDLDYIFPGSYKCPRSKLPDYGDRTHGYIEKEMTVLEMFNHFSDDIGSLENLEEMINGKKGYCECNKGIGKYVDKNLWGTFKVQLKLFEVKSVDWVGVRRTNGKRSARNLSTNEKEISHKIWAQNTYRFWWVTNTDYCFSIERLPFTHRTKGQETYQNFSTNIYKSQQKSAVELSIGENRKAQIADIKMEYAIIKSLPAGKYIDLRFLRSALEGLKAENKAWTQQDLIDLAFEQNILIGDTQGFDGKNDGQLKPFMEIPGGLKTEVSGYITTILNADRNISNFTGINEQLTGQSANAEELVGLQKLLINSSINSIHYAREAMEAQYQALFNVWAVLLQGAIEKGGKTKQAIIDFIGVDDTNVLDGLNESPLHNLTIKILIGQREVERQMYLNRLALMTQRGQITSVDEYMLSGIDNPKERFAYLAVTEKKWTKKQDEIRKEGFANQQQLVAQQGEQQQALINQEIQGDKEVVYAKGEVEAKILQLSQQLGLNASQVQYLQKLALQKDRNIAQKDKGISAIREKSNVKQQEALV